jgi:hypothetical protein
MVVKTIPSRTARRTRSKRAAPRFWPRIGPIDPASAKIAPKASGTIRPITA